MSKAKLKLRIILMCIFFVSIYSHLEANDSCTSPSYPDQEPFDSCINDESLLWEENSPVEEMGPDSSASIYFKGGRSPYTVSIDGNKFYLDSQGTTKKITINNTSTTIYTIDACGSTVITVTDDCGNKIEGSIRSTIGKWIKLGTFSPVNLRKDGPHPYINPFSLGMFFVGQTVAYKMTIPGYGTQRVGKYAIQRGTLAPTQYYDFQFYTGNSWGWGYYDDSLVNDPRTFFMDPIVGKFRIRAFGGTQYRQPNYYKYYCATEGLAVWEWVCNP